MYLKVIDIKLEGVLDGANVNYCFGVKAKAVCYDIQDAPVFEGLLETLYRRL